MNSPNTLEEKLKYQFKNPALLELALNHSSYANENRSRNIQSNERLEFLGDSILGMITAEYLFFTYGEMPEGELTRLRASLVCEQSLVLVAKELDLGEYIRLGRGEESGGGRQRPSILADAVEAVLAAVYLDGGYKTARKIIYREIFARTERSGKKPMRDYKTALQELVQRETGQVLSYRLLEESGPDHSKTFLVEVLLNDRPAGQGTGHSKKEAEQAAASAAIELLFP
ncbi:ribonuclease III [Papillibacter cinnamivorans]|uniref:Ribonuclease 3 n=1 Tax=Papillibacter cinnamivorans DSM 12816 TaxID=1122930 RepID=A0A1W1ZF63_9FIRM|nr:ribonuclease III [Papillibacter cinnamivorans]SMC46761.1 ribonuclease-3 [Papillibacter cinnamivorans DSM 12816]